MQRVVPTLKLNQGKGQGIMKRSWFSEKELSMREADLLRPVWSESISEHGLGLGRNYRVRIRY